jgi:acylphosphatase
MTRSQKVSEAIRAEITRQQTHIDSMPGLRGVSCMVKLKADGSVRVVVVTMETSTDDA